MDRATTGPPATTKTEAGGLGMRAGAWARQGRPNTSCWRPTRTGTRAEQGAAKCLKAAQHSAAQQDQHGRNWRGNQGLPQGTAAAGSSSRSGSLWPAGFHKAPQLQGTASAGYNKNRRQKPPTRPAKHPKAPQRRSSTPPRHTSATGIQDASHPAPASAERRQTAFSSSQQSINIAVNNKG
ncbi:hypothetical protein NDU88_009281 [Pleurodeles waltl]|uniref:Uncharacterized protein n=1 Tax=Pleurodeles waltl TaxID=8319 RepID=A0AAV7PUL7_PLEWA|nr:hypothetical protein NDU88_009281 [Pleurodeles waltl]